MYLALVFCSGLLARWRDLRAGLSVDVRQVLAQVRGRPRFHLGSAAVLALGLSMLTAAWGVDYGAYGRGLPVAAPERIVAVTAVSTTSGEESSAFSVADARVMRAAGRSRRSTPRRSSSTCWRSRQLAAGSLRPRTVEGSHRGWILTHRLWIRRYDADPGVIGLTVRVAGQPATIVGVLPPGPTFSGEDIWLPIPTDGEEDHARAWTVLARIRPGWSIPSVSKALAEVGSRLEEIDARESIHLRALAFTESFREPGGVGSRYLRVVTISGWLLFLIALSNVANLLLVRTRQRAREIAVRRALGASRFRVLRHGLMELTVTVVLAVAAGGLLASVLLDGYHALQTAYYSVPISWQQWGFSSAHVGVLARSAALAWSVLALVAALATLHAEGEPALREGRGNMSRLRLVRGLVAMEIACSGALFLLAALMIRSAWNLHTNDWGFAVESVMTAHLILPEPGNLGAEERLRVWTELEEGLARLPGVQSATLGTQLPVIRYAGHWGARRTVQVGDGIAAQPEGLPRHYVAAVTPSYFETFRAPVVAGRGFTSADVAESEPVALVNAAFAAAFFPDGPALRRRVRVWEGREPGPWRTVVGVAPHLWMDADENRDPEGVYLPLAQTAPPEASLAIRVRGDPSAMTGPIRRLSESLLPGVPILDVRTMPQLIRYRTRLYRKDGPLFIGLGLAALLLAAGGLYLVISYIATLRVGEFGIRAALGASRRALVTRALLWGLPPLAVGIPAGVVIGLWLTRRFARSIFEVDPWSPGVAVVGFTVLAVVALGTSLVPALRAGRVDLVRVLKAE